MKFDPNPAVLEVIESYPQPFRDKILRLRALVIETAERLDEVQALEETLKWGEPAYLTKTGSTVRVAWSKKKPDQYALYFHCGTSLVETFRELYSDKLTFEGNRAIVLQKTGRLPVCALRHCIELTLTYHAKNPRVR